MNRPESEQCGSDFVRYAFQRSSGFFIAAMVLYAALGVYWIIQSQRASDWILPIVLATGYLTSAVVSSLFPRGKRQFLLVVPFAPLLILYWFFVSYSVHYYNPDFGHLIGETTAILLQVSLGLYCLGLFLFFVSMFAPVVRYVSAAGMIAAAVLYALAAYIEGNLEAPTAWGDLWGYILFIAFMFPQALHVLTPRLKT